MHRTEHLVKNEDELSGDFSLEPLSDLMAATRKYHADYQIDHFILVKGKASVWGCLEQSLRELEGRVISLRALSRQRDEATERDDIYSLTRSIEGKAREAIRFWAHASALQRLVGSLTPNKRANLERRDWFRRMTVLACFDLLEHNRLSRSTVEALASIPADDADEIIGNVRSARRRKEDGGLLALVNDMYAEARNSIPKLPPTEELGFSIGRMIEEANDCRLSLPTTSRDCFASARSTSLDCGKSL